MEPLDLLTVRFHIGGEFVRVGRKLEYVGGDEEMSDIERDKLSLQEVKGYLADHLEVKDSMKYFFLIPGKDLADGLVFLHDDSSCVKMAEYIEPGGVADVFVEYHGEDESADSSSGSDFEDEMIEITDGEPDIVITAESDEVEIVPAEPAESDDDVVCMQDVLVTDDTGVVSDIIRSPVKHDRCRRTADPVLVSQAPNSQIIDPSQELADLNDLDMVPLATAYSDSDHTGSDSDDTEYMAHSEDSGEDSEVVELRKHARKFKKRMRATNSWIARDSSDSVPIELVANMEDQLGEEEKNWECDSTDDDYSYDEDSDGKLVRRKSKYPRFNNATDIPHFELTMVFRSKSQLCKALKRYGLATKRSISFVKSEHRMCARHIYANWRKKHRSHEWQKKFWAVAKAANKQDFNYYKAKLAQETPEGAKDIMKNDPEHWARAYFPVGSNCESVDNNLCESFNHAIVDARFYPIISMQEKIRKKIFTRIQQQREKGEKFQGKICPGIFKKLKAAIARTQFMEVLWNGKDGFEVKLLTGRKRQYTVSLEKRTCSCGYFQLAGLPCSHAITAIYKCGRLVEDFIAPCYSVQVYKSIYEHCLEPVEGEEMWPISEKPRPQAPGYVRMPGRPKKNARRREESEKPKGKKMSRHGISMRCSMCDTAGHNKSSCKKNPERGKKKNAHLVKETKKRKHNEQSTSAAGGSSSQPAPNPQARSVPPRPKATAKAFKPPRPKASVVPSSSTAIPGRRGKKGRAASSIPSYAYFNCSGNN